MRVLMTTTGGSGHLLPMVPFARACLRAGQDVRVAAQRARAGNVAAAGLDFAPFDDPSPEAWGQIMGRMAGLPLDEANAIMASEVFADINPRAALPGLLVTVEGWQPDIVVSEVTEVAGPLAAERHGIAAARVSLGLASMATWAMPLFAEPVGALRAELGLPADPRLRAMGSTPVLTLTPPVFEEPVDDDAGALLHPFRDAAGPAPEPLPDRWAGSDDPLVYLSFGSVAGGLPVFPGLYRAAIDALAPLPVRLLVTTGNDGDPAALGALPSNVRAERWVAQRDVLPHAAAVVCHGGFGSTLGALSHGVPLVVLPLFSVDQWANARRVAAVGAGIALLGDAGAPLGALAGPLPETIGALRDAVARVLDDPGHRRGAEAIAAAIAALPPVDDAVALLEALAAEAVPAG